MNWQPRQPAFRALLKAFLAETAPLYVVGGVVRDFLLGYNSDKTDIDLVVEQPAAPIAQRVADRLGWAFYHLDTDRDVARLVFTANNSVPLVCDVASLRGGSLEADLRARDFTVNAMAFVLGRQGDIQLVDRHGGQQDLAARLVRRVTASSLAEDPVRLLRAVRFVAQLDFTLEEQTLIQIKRMSTTVRLASPERIRDELWKTFLTAMPAQAIEHLQALGLLAHVLPEIHQMIGVTSLTPDNTLESWRRDPQDAAVDAYEHTLRTVRYAALLRTWLQGEPRVANDKWQAAGATQVQHPSSSEAVFRQLLNPWYARLRQHFAWPVATGRPRYDWLLWHALFHKGTPDAVTARLTHLRFSRQEVALATAVIRGLEQLYTLHTDFAGQPISRRACYRFFRDIGGKQLTATSRLAGIDTIFLALAVYQAHTATQDEASTAWLDYLAHAEQLLAFAFADNDVSHLDAKPLVNGRTLMENLHLSPGRQVGELLEELSEAQVAGDIQTPDQALSWATHWLQEQDLGNKE